MDHSFYTKPLLHPGKNKLTVAKLRDNDNTSGCPCCQIRRFH